MKPTELDRIRIVTAPSVHPSGDRVVYSVEQPSPEKNTYLSSLWLLDGDGDPRRLTVKPDQEPPRLITRSRYIEDGVGYLDDRPSKVFAVPVSEAADDVPASRQVTGGVVDDTDPFWIGNGERIGFRSRRDGGGAAKEVEDLAVDVFSCHLDGGDLRRHTDATMTVSAAAADPASNDIYYVASGLGDTGRDFVGRPGALYRLREGKVEALTSPQAIEVGGAPVVAGNRVLVGVEERGATLLVAVDQSGRVHRILDGLVTVASWAHAGGTTAAAVATPTAYGELYVGRDEPVARTDVGASLREVSPPYPMAELTATAADGYPVHGWVTRPTGDGPHPVLLNVHGGPFSQYPCTIRDEVQVYVRAGFAVVMCNPRGSSGYGGQHGRAIKDAIGTHDAADILAFLDAALEDCDLDGDRVGVMGGSYGGLMTTWLLAHEERFVAGISERALNAWDSFAGTSDIGWYFGDEYVGARVGAASPYTCADQITDPLLIIHSEKDHRCPLEQAQRLYARLRRNGVQTQMLVFPGEGHELSRSGQPRHRVQRFEHIIRWWDEHLPTG